MDGSDATLITYTIGDDVIAQTKSYWTWSDPQWILQSTDQPQYLLYDGHGSTRQLADSSGSIVDSFSYDGYGVLLQDDSVASANPGYTPAQTTSLLYASEMRDFDIGLDYLRNRWMEPLPIKYNCTTTEELVICHFYKKFLFLKSRNINELLKNIENANVYIIRWTLA